MVDHNSDSPEIMDHDHGYESPTPREFPPTKWGSVLSTVTDQLPMIDSDSETSSMTDDELEPMVFSRKITRTSNDVSPTDIESFLANDVSFVENKLSQYEENDGANKSDDDNQYLFTPINQDHPSEEEPMLSLNAFSNVDLDDILEGFTEYDQTTDVSTLLSPAGSPVQEESHMLMNQLVNLSSSQAVKGRGVGTNQNPKDGEDHAPRTSSCGVSANLPINQIELSSSKRTTIFLDLRNEAQPAQLVMESAEQPDETRTTKKDKSLEDNPENCPNQSSRLSVEDLSEDTESDDDDFENWRQLRNQFKSKSIVKFPPKKPTSTVKSGKPQSSTTDTLKQNKPSKQNEIKNLPKATENVQIIPKNSSNLEENSLKVKEKVGQVKITNGNGTNHIEDSDKTYKAIPTKLDEILNDPSIKDKDEMLRKIALAKVRAVRDKRVKEEKLTNGIDSNQTENLNKNGITNAGMNALKGLYERQRLKKESDTIESTQTDTIPNSVVRKKSSGKTTVLFAEEPKQGEGDEMNIYRGKSVSSSVVETKKTTSGIQTDESCIMTAEQLKKATEEKLRIISTKDLKVAARKVVEDKKQNHAVQTEVATQSTWNPSIRDSYAIVQNQRKQPPSTPHSRMSKPTHSTTNTVDWETRAKAQHMLEKAFRNMVNEKEAKMFPLLYERDFTFQEELPGIPPSIRTSETQKFVLLTFQMSSPGCLVMHRMNGGNRYVPIDTPGSLAITHSLILSWLLALVPDNLEKPYDPPKEDVFTIESDAEDGEPGLSDSPEDPTTPNLVEVPFNVISVQQVWQEETQTIATHAVVVPNFFYKPDHRRKKPKKENAFLQGVWQFLQSKRVQDVCPWHTKPESPLLYSLNETHLTCATKPMSTYITTSNEPQLIQKALSRQPGFFWKIFKTDEQSSSSPITSPNNQLETTICLLQREALTYPVCVMDMLLRLQLGCLDLVGIRLVYVTRQYVQQNTLSHRHCGDPTEVVPVVAMAIRGKEAITKIQNIIGPRDPVLARLTDQGSMNAIYGEQLSKRRGDEDVPTEMNVFHCPRGKDRVTQQLSVWFGGRINPNDDIIAPTNDIINRSLSLPTTTSIKPANGKGAGKNKGKSRNNSSSSPAKNNTRCPDISSQSYLVATRPSKICLIISARFPPQFIGDVISIIIEQGYWIEGLKRATLNEKKTSALAIPTRFIYYFNPPQNPDMTLNEEYYELDSWWLRPVCVFVIGRENASAHLSGLLYCLQTELMYKMVPNEEGHLRNATSQCFHVCSCSDAVNHAIGTMGKTPDIELGSGFSPRVFHSNPELEQVVVLTLVGDAVMKKAGSIMQTLLHGEFFIGGEDVYNPSYPDRYEYDCDNPSEFHGFELLGIKFIPLLSDKHAKELTPFEVGTKQWRESIRKINCSSSLICVLRRVNAFNVLKDVLSNTLNKGDSTLQDVDKLMSLTAEVAYRQIKTFFCDKELFSDNRCRPLLKYLPPPMKIAQYLIANSVKSDGEEGGGDSVNPLQNGAAKPGKKKKKNGKKENNAVTFPTEESIMETMLSSPQPLTTVLIIKPDAFPRHLVKILRRVEHEGFQVVAAKMMMMSEDQANHVVPSKFEKMPGEKSIFVSHMTSSTTLVLCLSRHNAVRRLLDMAGPPDPAHARKLEQNSGNTSSTLRGELGIDEFSNAVHVSETYISACEEQKLFFHEGLCCHETVELKMEQVPAPAHDYIMCLDKMQGREIKSAEALGRDTVGPSGMEIQPICVILTSKLVTPPPRSRRRDPKTSPLYIEVLEQLLSQGYEVCCLRMSWMRKEQGEKVCGLMAGFSPNKDDMLDHLTSGPSIVMLLQRENGLLLFDSIIGSCPHVKTSEILRTQSLSQTHSVCKYLFHRVDNHRSVVQMVHKRAIEWMK